MTTIQRFEDLEFRQPARPLCYDLFHLTLRDAFSKDFSLKDHIRISGGPVTDNIAEGFERGGKRVLKNYRSLARGACGETGNQLYRANDRNGITKEALDNFMNQTYILAGKINHIMPHVSRSGLKGSKNNTPITKTTETTASTET